MKRISLLKTGAALLLTVLLFICVITFSSTTTQTFATYTKQTVTPTKIVTATPEPSPSTTPKPSPTVVPSPTARATPKPTATSVPTAVPSPTVAITPTLGVTPTAVHPTPIVTQKAEPLPLPTVTQLPTVTTLKPTSDPVGITTKRKATTVSPEQDALYTSSRIVPLVVGTLLTLCLSAVGFVGVRRVRTALLPAIDLKRQKTHTFAHSWQRVRPATSPPISAIHAQETIPFSPVPVEPLQNSADRLSPVQASPFALLEAEHKVGLHRRLGPVRLRTMTEPTVVVPETPPIELSPTDIEDMSFLNDPMLQDTLRHYKQKGTSVGTD